MKSTGRGTLRVLATCCILSGGGYLREGAQSPESQGPAFVLSVIITVGPDPGEQWDYDLQKAGEFPFLRGLCFVPGPGLGTVSINLLICMALLSMPLPPGKVPQHPQRRWVWKLCSII